MRIFTAAAALPEQPEAAQVAEEAAQAAAAAAEEAAQAAAAQGHGWLFYAGIGALVLLCAGGVLAAFALQRRKPRSAQPNRLQPQCGKKEAAEVLALIEALAEIYRNKR